MSRDIRTEWGWEINKKGRREKHKRERERENEHFYNFFVIEWIFLLPFFYNSLFVSLKFIKLELEISIWAARTHIWAAWFLKLWKYTL